MYVYECVVNVENGDGTSHSGIVTVAAKNGMQAGRKAKAAVIKRLEFEGREWFTYRVVVMSVTVVGRQLQLL